MKKYRCTRLVQTFLLTATLLLNNATTFAQNTKELKFRHINIENGLFCNNVRSLLQDEYGYIWIGTGYGIARYDGHTFTYPRGAKSKASTHSFHELGDTIWIGYNEGVTFYSHR